MLPVVLDLIREYGTNNPVELCRCLKISVKKVMIPDMIDGIREEKLLTTERVLELLKVFAGTSCYIN